MTDPIADYLTRLRNAIKAKHKVVEIPASNIKKEITKSRIITVTGNILFIIINQLYTNGDENIEKLSLFM